MNAPHAFRAMNTDFLVAGLSAPSSAAVRKQVEWAEAAFSRFKPDSEISRINQSGGDWVSVSTLTYDLLADALAAFAATDGLFNPFLGRAMQAAGYDRSFELLKPESLQTREGSQQIADASFFHHAPAPVFSVMPLEMDAAGQRIRLLPEVTIDLGGIAKGWTAQRAADQLIAAGAPAGLIDAGGDVVVWGCEPEQGVWGIGVGHPLGREEDIADLWLEGLTAVATSSVAKRRWQKQGQGMVHHILDPRTGQSAVSDLLQATVLARDLVVAEQFAKCMIVLGSETGLAWLGKKRPDLSCILVRRDGAVLTGGNLAQYIKESELRDHVDLESTSLASLGR